MVVVKQVEPLATSCRNENPGGFLEGHIHSALNVSY